MATQAQEHLLAWLRDAHAMEEQAETLLTSQISRLKHYPDLRRKLEEHLEETKRQAKLVDDCIQRLGGDNSAVKDAMGKMVAMGQGLSGLFVDDEVIKGSLASYTFEHMEIASYTILVAAAEACGDTTTAAICSRILKEEQAMAQWLADHTPQAGSSFLAAR
jgi:ferritin-like metal-binding protein YciE